ncbi:MAG TPA: hypothetical protein VK192_13220 [Sphingomicrobium sp.]|jgi:hypothetical protein|nr:hypothetical protein [Sphingomicrobium sp.]
MPTPKDEAIAAIILSVAALGSSYGGFQAELWDSRRAADYSLAEQARTNASKEAITAMQLAAIDSTIFSQWLNAQVNGQAKLAAFYRMRFRPEFGEFFEPWLASDPWHNPKAAKSPMQTDSYKDKLFGQSRTLSAQADEHFATGQRANTVGDAYAQTVAGFAISLFLIGILQAFHGRRPRMVLMLLGAFACVMALARVLTLPAIRMI